MIKITFELKTAEEVRQSQTQGMQKKIKKFYEDLSKQVKSQIQKTGKGFDRAQLMLLQRDIETRLKEISKDIQDGIVDSMITTANALVEDTRTFLKRIGFENVEEAFSYVPDDVVRNILSGNIYKDGWKFSDAIWNNLEKNQKDIERIVAEGTAQGKTIYEIANDLEKYVNPNAYKEWNWSKVYPGTNKKIEYNAMRLARTLISHAYQQSFQTTNEKNPFCKDYVWHSAMIHGRTCELCKERDGKHYKKDELPLDHPNGLCTFEAYIPDSLEEIAEKIGMWYEAPLGTFPDIDEYAKTFLNI